MSDTRAVTEELTEQTDETLESIRGKTIADVRYERSKFNEYEVVTLTFTDGEAVSFASWDREHYESGIAITREDP